MPPLTRPSQRYDQTMMKPPSGHSGVACAGHVIAIIALTSLKYDPLCVCPYYPACRLLTLCSVGQSPEPTQTNLPYRLLL